MSFVVEIPSVFTKPTQIPLRLGNTILTGNETIKGTLNVNQSITLNEGISVNNTNMIYYDSLDISNELTVGNANMGVLITPNDLIVNSININNKDAFFYGNNGGRVTTGTNAILSWNLTVLGTNINNNGFIASRTGLYSIILGIFFTYGSSGEVKLGLKINDIVYRNSTYLVSGNSTNRDVNMFTGNIIVNLNAGERITAFVISGTLYYWGRHSYMSGFYIGQT